MAARIDREGPYTFEKRRFFVELSHPNLAGLAEAIDVARAQGIPDGARVWLESSQLSSDQLLGVEWETTRVRKGLHVAADPLATDQDPFLGVETLLEEA